MQLVPPWKGEAGDGCNFLMSERGGVYMGPKADVVKTEVEQVLVTTPV